jgi:hypothetical protein
VLDSLAFFYMKGGLDSCCLGLVWNAQQGYAWEKIFYKNIVFYV